jgi:hypothetical protein
MPPVKQRVLYGVVGLTIIERDRYFHDGAQLHVDLALIAAPRLMPSSRELLLGEQLCHHLEAGPCGQYRADLPSPRLRRAFLVNCHPDVNLDLQFDASSYLCTLMKAWCSLAAGAIIGIEAQVV